MDNKDNTQELPETLKVSAVINQITEDKLLEWFYQSLNRDKKLRLKFLTKFASEVNTRDIQSKYQSLCRKIKKSYGATIDRHKKLSGKRMYMLFDELLYQAQDQLSLDNYLEAYEITYSIHGQLFHEYLAEQLNKTGIKVLMKTYEIMNYLSRYQLPPPLIKKIEEDWFYIFRLGQFKVFDVNYNPYSLLFAVLDNDKMLYEYLSEQLKQNEYSINAHTSFAILCNYASQSELNKELFNKYISSANPIQIRKLTARLESEKKSTVLHYLVSSISMRNDKKYDTEVLRMKIRYSLKHGKRENAWNDLLMLLNIDFSEENEHLLLDFVEKNTAFLNEVQGQHLRKLENSISQEHKWKLLSKMNRVQELKTSLLSCNEPIEIVPFLRDILPDYKNEVIIHFKTNIEEFLQLYYGKQSISYVQNMLSKLTEYGHHNIKYTLIKAIDKRFSERPSIREFLTSQVY